MPIVSTMSPSTVRSQTGAIPGTALSISCNGARLRSESAPMGLACGAATQELSPDGMSCLQETGSACVPMMQYTVHLRGEAAPGGLARRHLYDCAAHAPDVRWAPMPCLLDDLGGHPVRRSLHALES